MNACKRLHSSVLTLSIFAALCSAACTIRPVDGSTDDATNEPKEDPNLRVDNVVVVGTSVTAALYTTGEMGLTTVAKDRADQAVVDDALDIAVRITSPANVATTVGETKCTAPDPTKKFINVGVILDDSGSMAGSDPEMLRKKATIGFLNTLGAEDKVLLTDYGVTGNNLRDLLCISQGGTEDTCSPPKGLFSSDKTSLIKAAEEITIGGGTPLFESCVEMMPLVDAMKEGRRGVLLLSDGNPNSNAKRDACHTAAKAAQIPVFTVGLGPAAEGDKNADADAVKVLRELATETGGSYASANDAAQLDGLFRNMGTALARGSCRTTARLADAAAKIQPGTKVTGEVTVGAKGAKATFEFVAPEKQ